MPSSSSGLNYKELDGIILVIRPNSIRFNHTDTDKSVWIPRSLIHGGQEMSLNELDTPQEYARLKVQTWFCEQEGLS